MDRQMNKLKDGWVLKMDGWKDDGLRSEQDRKRAGLKDGKDRRTDGKRLGSNTSKHIEKTLDFNKHNFLMKYVQIIHCSYNNKTELKSNHPKRMVNGLAESESESVSRVQLL